MAVYAIITKRPEASLLEALEQTYPGKYHTWSENFSAVVTSDSPTTIAAKLGIKRRSADGSIVEGITDAVITKLAATYNGWGPKNFWDWLKNAHQQADD